MKKGTLEIKTNLGEIADKEDMAGYANFPEAPETDDVFEEAFEQIKGKSLRFIKNALLHLNAKIEINPEEKTISIK